MKRLYKLWHEFDDENSCLAIVANSVKDAKLKWRWEFDYVEWDLDRKEFTFWLRCKRLKQFDVSNMDLWYLDGRQGILWGIYRSCDEVWCDKCGKNYGYSTLQDDGTIQCWKCAYGEDN